MNRQRGFIVTELAGVFVGMLVVAVISTTAFFVEGPKGVEQAWANFCVQQLKGKWEPQPTPGDSCPGGNWQNVIVQPKSTGPSTPTK